MMRKQLKRSGCLIFAACLLFLTLGRASAAETLGLNEELLRGCDINGSTNTETSMGDVTADAAAALGAADIALLPSGDFGTNLQPGPVTEDALVASLQKDSELAVTDLTGRQIWMMLEHGLSHITVGEDALIDTEGSRFDGYLQISGLKIVYDASAPTGERLIDVQLTDGTPIRQEEETTTYRVVSTTDIWQGGYGYPTVPADRLECIGTERDVLRAVLVRQGSLSVPEGGRVEVCGTRDWIQSRQPVAVILLIVVCLIVGMVRKRNQKIDPWHSSETAAKEEIEQALPAQAEQY